MFNILFLNHIIKFICDNLYVIVLKWCVQIDG